MRHSPIWLFLGALSIPMLLAYTLLGLLHPWAYEAGYWLATHGNDVAPEIENEKITYAENMVGAIMAGGLVGLLSFAF